VMFPMQPPRILRKRAFPRHGHSQEQRIQTRIVKAFSKIAPVAISKRS
jgi:hypothetical protein